MKKQDIYMLERTKDATSSIIGFYNTEERAIDAIRRAVNGLIDKGIAKVKAEGSEDLTGVYISEGFLITRSRAEVDPGVEFDKMEDPEEFPVVEKAVTKAYPDDRPGQLTEGGHMYRDRN